MRNIDINGNATPPNAIGRDLFAMMLLEDGTVIAEGSIKDFMHYPTYSAENYCNAKEVKSGTYCGGAIVDNGGKVTYKW